MCKIKNEYKHLINISSEWHLFYYMWWEKEMECFSGHPPQAFLELNSEECAQTMVSYYSSVTPVIRNHPIYMQYSTHKELKTDNSPNQVVRTTLTFHVWFKAYFNVVVKVFC